MQDQHLGPVVGHARQDQAVQDGPRLGVVIAPGNGQVEGAALPGILQLAGKGPAPLFMDRDHPHPRIARKPQFHPVAMVRVKVDISDAGQAVRLQHLDRQHHVVQVAKPVRPVG